MTIAELHGKISRTGENLSERLEDLLTSDVFSACRYVRPNILLLPFLLQAIGLKGIPLQNLVKNQVERARYLFWPHLTRSEPDVLISLEFSSGNIFIVLIEAKYFSPKSSSPLSEPELEIAETPRDQLAREYEDLFDAHKVFHVPVSKIKGRALIYITAHRAIPINSINESIEEIKKFHLEQDEINIFWTSWFNLHPIISRIKDALHWEYPILGDLRQLLERKRLVHFKGFSLDLLSEIPNGSLYAIEVEKRPIHYAFALAEETLLTRPIFYSSRTETCRYEWHISAKPLVGKIYKGDAL